MRFHLPDGPSNGYEVSRTARIPAANYETLSRLKAKGAVISSATDHAMLSRIRDMGITLV